MYMLTWKPTHIHVYKHVCINNVSLPYSKLRLPFFLCNAQGQRTHFAPTNFKALLWREAFLLLKVYLINYFSLLQWKIFPSSEKETLFYNSSFENLWTKHYMEGEWNKFGFYVYTYSFFTKININIIMLTQICNWPLVGWICTTQSMRTF